jgi:MOSC domain-containing protein YiiM
VRRMRFGQRYRVGQAMIELTKMRGPCRTLDVYNANGLVLQDAIYDKQVREGDVSSPRWGMSGFYASVASPGVIRSGDIIALVDQAV